MSPKPGPRHVSLVATPDVMLATLAGLYDVFNCFGALGWFDESLARNPPFLVDVVAPRQGMVDTASGLRLPAQKAFGEIASSDIVILPSNMVRDGAWETGRYPELVQWLNRINDQGGELCSACSGTLLLAETGLLDGREATMHWAYAETFRRNFPAVKLRIDKSLVVEGDRNQFVMSGAASSWSDLALYLIARHVGAATAQAVAKFFAFQWHSEGLAAFAVFDRRWNHGDAAVEKAQRWIVDHYTASNPVERMLAESGLAERSFKRRFKKATGHTVIRFVQELRLDEAKRHLERTNLPIDEIAWEVGYEDATYFRRLFKRNMGMTPGQYRQKFQLPDFIKLPRESARSASRPVPRAAG